MDRRGFLGSILVACAAPAIVRADSLMRIIPLETAVYSTAVPAIVMSGNRLLTIDQITREALLILGEELRIVSEETPRFWKGVFRDYEIGDVIHIRRPSRVLNG